MKRILTLLIAASFSTVAFAKQSDDQTPYMTKSLANDAINNVNVTTSAGGIIVSGKSGEAARVEVYIKGNNGHKLTKEEIQKRLDENYDLHIDVNGHELNASVKTKKDHMDWDHDGLSISFKIYVPENASTDLRTSGGGIMLDHLKGHEHFVTSGGGLIVDNLNGDVNGRTSGGGIIVSNSGNNIDLETSGGGIIAKNCDGEISLNTSGGGIQLKDLKGHIKAHTSGGGIECERIDGELVTGTSGGGIAISGMSGSLEAVSSAGSVAVTMTHVDKYLKLNTSSGNVSLKLPAKEGYDLNMSADRISEKIAENFNGSWDKQNVSGTVNGGGAKVDVHSSNNIALSLD